eukprot:gnl/MRDRNA2_/MRDRNA2_133931_c0_seq1.p1 gnl/MRDRNA2_/MRDRNA2_133931_c0~~gnl/MRDRNA2_/MRDRNA2_133931_c0_seq1.p1  ORF type:complete len:649 (+),score=77.11 gnl/MRDRNA2_/MRDRNA2_133931_c0_seq1:233-1948(+)
MTPQGTVWIRTKEGIRRRYLRTWFTMDAISCLPFNVVGLALEDEDMSKLKVVRIVKLLRLLKLVRIFRATRIMKRWESRTSLSFATQGLMKFWATLLVMSHWMACQWGGIGAWLSTDLKCHRDNPMNYQIKETIHGGSWVTARTWGQHSPCSPWDLYLASLHFSVMTITGIGYGDIVPTRNEEVLLGIASQLIGGMIWVFTIGQMCRILSNGNPVRAVYENSMDSLNRMLKEQGVDFELCLALRDFVREKQYHDHFCRSHAIKDQFSPILQAKLIPQTVIGKAIRTIWYFRGADEVFIVEVAAALTPSQYGNQDKIGGKGILSILQRGSVVRSGRILCPGCIWGEDMILSDQDLIDPTLGMALNYVEVLALTKHRLDEILSRYPKMDTEIRKAATLITFRIVVKLASQKGERKIARQSLVDALSQPASRGSCSGESTESLHLAAWRKKSRQLLLRVGSFHEKHEIPKDDARTNSAIAKIGNIFERRPSIPGSGMPASQRRPSITSSGMPASQPTQDIAARIDAGFQSIMSEIINLKDDVNSVKDDMQTVKKEWRKFHKREGLPDATVHVVL